MRNKFKLLQKPIKIFERFVQALSLIPEHCAHCPVKEVSHPPKHTQHCERFEPGEALVIDETLLILIDGMTRRQFLLLNMIDYLSKFGYSFIVKDKSADEVERCLKVVFKHNSKQTMRKPWYCCTKQPALFSSTLRGMRSV